MSLVSQYLQYTDGTEPPKQYHRWSFLSCVGAALSRRIWMQHGHSKVFPNMYVILVGAPGTRKSSAIKTARKLLESGEYDTFSYNKSTKQKFLLDLQELHIPKKPNGEMDTVAMLEAGFNVNLQPTSTDCFICADEFADFIGTNNLEFITLLTTLWDNLDKYEDRIKNSSSIKIDNPTINILGGVTPVSFVSAIPQEASGSGFLSRVLLVYGETTGTKITWPTIPDSSSTAMFGSLFAKLQELEGEAKFTPEARRVIGEIYTEFSPLQDVRLQYYCSRRLMHLFKLCMIFAALHAVIDDCDVIEVTKDIVVEANTVLTYTEDSMSNALGEMGRARNSDATQRVVEMLSEAKALVSFDSLWKSVMHDLETPKQLMEILRNLIRAGKIRQSEIRTANPSDTPDVAFIMAVRKSGKDRPHVDYARYIEEYEERHEKLNII